MSYYKVTPDVLASKTPTQQVAMLNAIPKVETEEDREREEGKKFTSLEEYNEWRKARG